MATLNVATRLVLISIDIELSAGLVGRVRIGAPVEVMDRLSILIFGLLPVVPPLPLW
jgi:uncharacterized protein YhhL (DUF1145 family)